MGKITNLVFSRVPRKIYLILYDFIFHRYSYIKEVEKAASQFHSLLDVGCGGKSPIRKFSKNMYTVGCDLFEPSIEQSRKEGIHNEYFLMNILDICKKFKPKSFECVLSCETLEHLTKKEGIKLLDQMEKIASKRVVIFTPNGFIHQNEYGGNPFQVHKSGWTMDEMENRGYKVIGINGWKPLRGEEGVIRFKPTYFWETISYITQILFARRLPKIAFQLCCIKNI